MTDAALALAEFDRWLRVHGHEEDENEERHFFDWLPLWYADPVDRAAITAAWDARAAERRERLERQEAEREEREAAAEQAAAEQATARRKALDDDVQREIAEVGYGDNEAFQAWWRPLADSGALDAKGRLVLQDGTVLVDGRDIVDHWLEIDSRQRRAEQRERERLERQEAEREERNAAEERKRAELAERLKDGAWARGEDAASLRAVAAWRRVHERDMVFKLKEGAARDALLAADRALMSEVAASVAAAEAVNARNAKDRVLRAARHVADEPVPPTLDLRGAADRDAVARWLAAHRDELATFEAGRWWPTFPSDDLMDHAWTPVAGFCRFDGRGDPTPGDMQLRAARWAAYWAIEAEAAAHPEDADELRGMELRVLAGERYEGVDDHAWAFVPPKPPMERIDEEDEEAEPRAKAEDEIPRVRRPRSPAQKRRALQRRIQAAIRKGHGTKTAVYDAVGGNKKDFDELFKEMLERGDVQRPDDEHAGFWLDE